MIKDLITNEQWDFMKVFLPSKKNTGRPRVDDKKLLNGIIFVLRTGCRWGDMPLEYGNGKTAHRRFQELIKLNFFENIKKNSKKYRKTDKFKESIN